MAKMRSRTSKSRSKCSFRKKKFKALAKDMGLRKGIVLDCVSAVQEPGWEGMARKRLLRAWKGEPDALYNHLSAYP